MNDQFGYTFEGIVVDRRIITVTIVKIHIIHLTHLILQTAVGRMMLNKETPELVIENNSYFFSLTVMWIVWFILLLHVALATRS